MTIHSVSYGGGVQSTALLVLAAHGMLPDFNLFLFANVGDDSEHPDTLDYVRNVAMPYAQRQGWGLEILELRRTKRDGTQPTLWTSVMDDGREVIPIRGENGMPMSRTCTVDWKIKVIAKELKARGATAEDPATVAIGISTDEASRANTGKREPHETLVYPLLDFRMNRSDCMEIIRDEGLPVPPKSSCFFCPFHRVETWHDLRRDRPDLFAKAKDLEAHLSARSMARRGKALSLTRFNKPLGEVIPDGVDLLPFADDGDGLCDTGWCMT